MRTILLIYILYILKFPLVLHQKNTCHGNRLSGFFCILRNECKSVGISVIEDACSQAYRKKKRKKLYADYALMGAIMELIRLVIAPCNILFVFIKIFH